MRAYHRYHRTRWDRSGPHGAAGKRHEKRARVAPKSTKSSRSARWTLFLLLKPAHEPVWGDPDYEAFLRAKYREIRNAHLAYRLPTLAERDDALKRGEALPEMIEHMEKDSRDLRNKSVHFGFPFGHPTGETALFAVAVLRRAGYGVTLVVDRDMNATMIQLDRCGAQLVTPLNKAKGLQITSCAKLDLMLEVEFPGTAPSQLARRGVLWCIPRFKRWAKRTIEHMYTPDGNGARRAAERFAMLA